MFSLPPHLLKLYSYFVECLGDDGDEHVPDHPGQKEDHGDEVDDSFPVLGGIAGTVHYVHPPLLTSSWKRKGLS